MGDVLNNRPGVFISELERVRAHNKLSGGAPSHLPGWKDLGDKQRLPRTWRKGNSTLLMLLLSVSDLLKKITDDVVHFKRSELTRDWNLARNVPCVSEKVSAAL